MTDVESCDNNKSSGIDQQFEICTFTNNDFVSKKHGRKSLPLNSFLHNLSHLCTFAVHCISLEGHFVEWIDVERYKFVG